MKPVRYIRCRIKFQVDDSFTRPSSSLSPAEPRLQAWTLILRTYLVPLRSRTSLTDKLLNTSLAACGVPVTIVVHGSYPNPIGQHTQRPVYPFIRAQWRSFEVSTDLDICMPTGTDDGHSFTRSRSPPLRIMAVMRANVNGTQTWFPVIVVAHGGVSVALLPSECKNFRDMASVTIPDLVLLQSSLPLGEAMILSLNWVMVQGAILRLQVTRYAFLFPHVLCTNLCHNSLCPRAMRSVQNPDSSQAVSRSNSLATEAVDL